MKPPLEHRVCAEWNMVICSLLTKNKICFFFLQFCFVLNVRQMFVTRIIMGISVIQTAHSISNPVWDIKLQFSFMRADNKNKSTYVRLVLSVIASIPKMVFEIFHILKMCKIYSSNYILSLNRWIQNSDFFYSMTILLAAYPTKTIHRAFYCEKRKKEKSKQKKWNDYVLN